MPGERDTACPITRSSDYLGYGVAERFRATFRGQIFDTP